ncbi:Carboxylesterase NlhH [Paramyrothecium foliicola]|nr:Carboxylesterase NlhH [Paramyrothecium foliicola]
MSVPLSFATTESGSATPMIRPPYDPLLVGDMEKMSQTVPKILDLTTLRNPSSVSSDATFLRNLPDIQCTDYEAPGLYDGDEPVKLSVFTEKSPASRNQPAVYFVHGGGQVTGNRFTGVDWPIQHFGDIGIVVISVEYRLSPEHTAPAALNDSYAGLIWTADNAEQLGIDPTRIIVMGGSGGAPIALGCTIKCRGEGKPYPFAQMILTPMLDDRNDTVSAKQYQHDGFWCGASNKMAWDLVLGQEVRGGPDVEPITAPARMTDLEGLPPTFIDAGECEVFRDEAVALASQLWKCGVSTELHIWPGAYHGFDVISQNTPVAQDSIRAKKNWMHRVLNGKRN